MNQCPDANNRRIVLGKLGKVHGIKGWLKLQSFTDPPENILQYSEFLVDQKGQRLSVQLDASHQHGNGITAHFKGYDTPESAKVLTGAELSVPTEQLPELQAGEFYWFQLHRLRVSNEQGVDFGVIKQLIETGANDVLVVTPDENSCDDRERLIPYLAEQVILNVDLDAGAVKVKWEADYLD